jgi:hypothetical protein
MECPICSDPIEGGERLMSCSHSVCPQCLEDILLSSSRCPICRKPIVEAIVEKGEPVKFEMVALGKFTRPTEHLEKLNQMQMEVQRVEKRLDQYEEERKIYEGACERLKLLGEKGYNVLKFPLEVPKFSPSDTIFKIGEIFEYTGEDIAEDEDFEWDNPSLSKEDVRFLLTRKKYRTVGYDRATKTLKYEDITYDVSMTKLFTEEYAVWEIKNGKLYVSGTNFLQEWILKEGSLVPGREVACRLLEDGSTAYFDDFVLSQRKSEIQIISLESGRETLREEVSKIGGYDELFGAKILSDGRLISSYKHHERRNDVMSFYIMVMTPS